MRQGTGLWVRWLSRRTISDNGSMQLWRRMNGLLHGGS